MAESWGRGMSYLCLVVIPVGLGEETQMTNQRKER